MSATSRHVIGGYVIAAAGVLVAGLTPWWLSPLTGTLPPMRLMLAVVVTCSAWLGGKGPGLFATAAGLVAIVVTQDLPGDSTNLWTKLGRFGSLALLITVLFEGMHAQRRRAELKEREFLRSEGRYRRLVEAAGEGIWALDRDGRTVYANPRLGEILGVPAGATRRPAPGGFPRGSRVRPARLARPARRHAGLA